MLAKKNFEQIVKIYQLYREEVKQPARTKDFLHDFFSNKTVPMSKVIYFTWEPPGLAWHTLISCSHKKIVSLLINKLLIQDLFWQTQPEAHLPHDQQPYSLSVGENLVWSSDIPLVKFTQ